MNKKISQATKTKVHELRDTGLSYAKIAKEAKISASSVIKILKEQPTVEQPKEEQPIEAKILKPCPNPRIILIYFNNDKADFAKCVVRAGLNYPAGKPLLVKKVETTNEKLYRPV